MIYELGKFEKCSLSPRNPLWKEVSWWCFFSTMNIRGWMLLLHTQYWWNRMDVAVFAKNKIPEFCDRIPRAADWSLQFILHCKF